MSLLLKYQHRVLGLLSLLAIITYLDRVCIAVAGPRMQDALNITPKEWGWISAAFFMAYAAFEIPTGVLGDRVGPRRILTRVVIWWSAFTSITGTVSSYPLLLIVRFFFGMGEAGAYPNASTVIGRWFPPSKRARAWGVIWMTSQLGAALAPLLIVPIQARYGWRISFYGFGILGILWSAVWFVWFRDSPREKPGISTAELVEIGDAAVAGHSMPWRSALRSPVLWRIAAIGACYVYVLAFFQSWLQTYLVKGRGFTEAALVLSTLPYLVGACANGLGGLTSDLLARRLGLKKGRRIIGIAGLGAAAIFMAATLISTTAFWALTFLSLSYAGILFQQPNLCSLCLDCGKQHAGAVFGFMNTAGFVASSISSVVFGYLVEYTGNYNTPFIPMLVLLCVGTYLWIRMDATRQIFATPDCDTVFVSERK